MQVPIRTLHCLNTSDPELLYSHCWQVKTRVFKLDLDISLSNYLTKEKSPIPSRIGFFGGSLVLKLSFSNKDPQKNPIRDMYYFFSGVFSTKIQFLLLKTPHVLQ